MNPFDSQILHFLNQFARLSWTFDSAMILINSNQLLKGGVVMALFAWIWFREDKNRTQHRETLLFGAFASVAALFVARLLAFALPFRERPLREPLLGFQVPYGMDDKLLIHWNSFPSDHAVLFFALTATIFFVAPRAGLFSLAHTILVVCLPRVYLGIHYPTDILAGALIGVAVASLSRIATLRHWVTRSTLTWFDNSPGLSYAFLFLLTFQIAVLFDPLRQLLIFVALLPGLVLTIFGAVLALLLGSWYVTRLTLHLAHTQEAVRQSVLPPKP